MSLVYDLRGGRPSFEYTPFLCLTVCCGSEFTAETLHFLIFSVLCWVNMFPFSSGYGSVLTISLVLHFAGYLERQMSPMHSSEPVVLASGSVDIQARHSSSSELSHLDQGFDSSDPNRSHHLLKHCLSDGQRGEALAHFSSYDVKEAAKEISKMGQRDLQSKFKLVYGTATHSNNNDWLRRKLYEAIGAAPVKIVTKPKPRKLASKQRKAHTVGDALHSIDDCFMHRFERRSRRVIRGTPKGQALAETLRGPRVLSSSLPSSPIVGRSVLDMHRFIAHEATTSTSDDSQSWDDEKDADNEEEEKPQQLSQRCDSLEAGPRILTVNRFISNTVGSPFFRPSAPVSMFPRRPSFMGLLGLASMNLDSSNDAWGSDAWADAALKATATRGPSFGLADEDDIMLLPMDLSAYDEDAVALV